MMLSIFVLPKSQLRKANSEIALVGDSTINKAPGFTLVWSDEFNKDGFPDTTKWNFEKGFVRNSEAQWYQKENASCLDGYLVITGKKEHKKNLNYIAGSENWRTNREYIEYTSASLKQKKEFAFKYGRVIIRAKIIASQGLWPAIWTVGVSGNWPYNGECDIMEYYKGGLHANFAHGSLNPNKPVWNSVFKKMETFDNSKWDEDFHVWRLDWNKDSMEIYVDDLLLNSIKLSETHNLTNGINPFRQAHYLRLNLALGGDSGGSLSETHLPSQYLIDYVRVYQYTLNE
ncbi:glycoside hydrolase family 16 protein [Pedobacter arcticus]|uniref:glycoside hydrolase family 16 protein n=1 Tax=Pedobacter arcticus TaxID=752140 RepID=UPI0002ED6521|nr:glycoside hydrolase family 16 protein [Pedobacter arcticus]